MKKETALREIRKRSMFQESMHRLLKNKTAVTGMIVLAVVILLCLCAGLICPEGYDCEVIMNKFIKPCREYPLGTDALGRSMLARVLYGGRYSIFISLAATAVATVIGVILGAIAGYYGGKTDNIIMRALDVFNAIPNLLLAIAISSVTGGGLFNAIMAIGISSVPMYARTARGPILAIKEQEYVEAAKSLDATDFRIIFKHVLPNILSPIIIQVSQGVSHGIITAASLSFLGLGVQAPIPEWGALLSSSRQYIREYPYLVIVPGVCIAVVVLAMNLFGDGLRDALDPKLKN